MKTKTKFETPVELPPQMAATPTGVSEAGALNGVHQLMVSSLPIQASGADVYARQFYRGSTVPFRRYLPITKF